MWRCLLSLPDESLISYDHKEQKFPFQGWRANVGLTLPRRSTFYMKNWQAGLALDFSGPRFLQLHKPRVRLRGTGLLVPFPSWRLSCFSHGSLTRCALTKLPHQGLDSCSCPWLAVSQSPLGEGRAVFPFCSKCPSRRQRNTSRY